MAIATYTASDQAAVPRLYHGGVTAARTTWTLNAAGSLSASDIVLCVKLPNQCWVLDGYITGTTGGILNTWKVGISTDAVAFHSGATLSGTAQLVRFNGRLPVKISLSDSANPQYTYLKLEFLGGAVSPTATASIDVFVLYAADGALY